MSDSSNDPTSDFGARAEDTARFAQDYVRANPLPIIFIALLIGAVLALFLSKRQPKKTDVVQVTREWLEGVYEQLADKIAQSKKHSFHLPSCPSTLLDQAQELKKKLQWW